jgi:hypothetical protein
MRRLVGRRIAPKRIWQSALALILLMGIYVFLPAPEIAIARQWLEAMLARLK